MYWAKLAAGRGWAAVANYSRLSAVYWRCEVYVKYMSCMYICMCIYIYI